LRPGATGDTDHVTGTTDAPARPTATDQAQGPRRAAAGALRECAVVCHPSPPNYSKPPEAHASTARCAPDSTSNHARVQVTAPQSEGARSASALRFAGVNRVHCEIALTGARRHGARREASNHASVQEAVPNIEGARSASTLRFAGVNHVHYVITLPRGRRRGAHQETSNYASAQDAVPNREGARNASDLWFAAISNACNTTTYPRG